MKRCSRPASRWLWCTESLSATRALSRWRSCFVLTVSHPTSHNPVQAYLRAGCCHALATGNTNREPNRFYGQFVHRISVVVDWSRLWWTVAVMLVGWTRRQLIRALSLSGTRAPQLDRSLQPCGRPVRSALPTRHQVWGFVADARASEAAGSLAVSFAAWHSPKVF